MVFCLKDRYPKALFEYPVVRVNKLSEPIPVFAFPVRVYFTALLPRAVLLVQRKCINEMAHDHTSNLLVGVLFPIDTCKPLSKI